MNEHDEFTDTGILRFHKANDLATAQFIAHFLKPLKTELPELEKVPA